MFNLKSLLAFSVKLAPQNTWFGQAKRLPIFQFRIGVVPVWFTQLFRFGLVGILNTLVDAVFYFLLSRLELVPHLVLAKGISYGLGVVNSFYWNKAWTFKSHVESRRIFLPFVATNLLAVSLNAGIMYLALNPLGWSEAGALVLATVTTFVWNFVVSKCFIFMQV